MKYLSNMSSLYYSIFIFTQIFNIVRISLPKISSLPSLSFIGRVQSAFGIGVGEGGEDKKKEKDEGCGRGCMDGIRTITKGTVRRPTHIVGKGRVVIFGIETSPVLPWWWCVRFRKGWWRSCDEGGIAVGCVRNRNDYDSDDDSGDDNELSDNDDEEYGDGGRPSSNNSKKHTLHHNPNSSSSLRNNPPRSRFRSVFRRGERVDSVTYYEMELERLNEAVAAAQAEYIHSDKTNRDGTNSMPISGVSSFPRLPDGDDDGTNNDGNNYSKNYFSGEPTSLSSSMNSMLKVNEKRMSFTSVLSEGTSFLLGGPSLLRGAMKVTDKDDLTYRFWRKSRATRDERNIDYQDQQQQQQHKQHHDNHRHRHHHQPPRSSSTGFVTFRNLTTLSLASRAPLVEDPASLQTFVAPDPRDILWENGHIDLGWSEARENIANAVLILGAVLWSIPVASIQAIATAEHIGENIGGTIFCFLFFLTHSYS